MNYALLDGTEVEYRVLTPADVAAALHGTTEDTQMVVEVVRLAVAKPENVLERLAGLPDPIGQTALLGTEITLASLRARARLVTVAVEQATARVLCDHHDPPAGAEQRAGVATGKEREQLWEQMVQNVSSLYRDYQKKTQREIPVVVLEKQPPRRRPRSPACLRRGLGPIGTFLGPHGGETMSDFGVFEVPNFLLQKGGILPVARLAYATRGTLNRARDNAVLVPSWYTGTHDDSETFMLGDGRALDPKKYFIILTNLLANGLSSSPSNSPPPVERGRFPKVTLHDNVRLQYQLISEQLGIERLRLVTGFSMGACQTFQWAAQFPDMVRAACPIAGSARTGNFNKVFLLALRRALELDPAYAGGFYDRPPVNGLKALAAIYAGWGTSEPFFREEAFRPLGSRSTAEHVADFWEPFFLRCDANNLLSQLWTWEAGDISANPTFGFDFEAALSAIKARTIIVPIDNDRYFPPVDSKNEAKHIPGAEVRIVASTWGHMALTNPVDIPAIDAPLKELLAG